MKNEARKRWRKTGRKRKSTVMRDTTGKSRGEPQVVHPDTIARRHLTLIQGGLSAKQAAEHALNPLAGSCLGQLRLRGPHDDPGGISQAQYAAGARYGAAHAKYRSLVGLPSPTTKSASAAIIGRMTGHPADPDEKQVAELRETLQACRNALNAAAAENGGGVITATLSVILDDPDITTLTRDHICALRVGLNALGRAFEQIDRAKA